MLFPILVKSVVIAANVLAKVQQWRAFRVMQKHERYSNEIQGHDAEYQKLRVQIAAEKNPPQSAVVSANVAQSELLRLSAKVPRLEEKATNIDATAVLLLTLADWLNNCRNRFVFGTIGTLGGMVTATLGAYWLAKTNPEKLFDLFIKIDSAADWVRAQL